MIDNQNMLNKVIFYQPKNYPEENIIVLENMIIPSGDYSYCQRIENKINEYSGSIGLDITLFILEMHKDDKDCYDYPDEFSWILNNNLLISEMNNTILLEDKSKDILLNNYLLFEPLFRLQLENIYHFLKTNYSLNDYFTKKYTYNKLQQKLLCKDKNIITKI